MEILTTREWATIIWLVILFFYMLTKEKTRSSLYKVIKTFFGKRLRILWLIYFLYISLITFLFSLVPFWKTIFIKDIIVWALFSGINYIINAAAREADENYIKKIIKDNFKLIVIFEFILNTFTFNIFVELLIIPIFTIISIMSLISERDIKYRNVHRLTDFLMILLGFIIIFKTIDVGINEYKQLNVLDTLISFFIPIIYLMLTLPLIYIISLYSKYEVLFLRMSFKEEDKKLIKDDAFR